MHVYPALSNPNADLTSDNFIAFKVEIEVKISNTRVAYFFKSFDEPIKFGVKLKGIKPSTKTWATIKGTDTYDAHIMPTEGFFLAEFPETYVLIFEGQAEGFLSFFAGSSTKTVQYATLEMLDNELL